jgi:biopolymer transport protein ExbD
MPDAGPWSPSRIAIQRAEKRRPTYLATLNLWPFAAVLLALLMMFMSGGRPHQQRWTPVDLPVVLHAVPQPQARREDAIIIVMRRDGSVFFRTDRIRPEDIPAVTLDALKTGSERKVYLAADTHAKYGDISAIANQIRLAGISQICFLADKSTTAGLQ